MIPNNNLSVLPWYTSRDQQDARKWWAYGHVYPLFTPAGFLLPWQLMVPHINNGSVNSITAAVLFDGNTDSQIGTYLSAIRDNTTYKAFTQFGYDVFVFPGLLPIFNAMLDGRYYLRLTINGQYYYSEIFTVVNYITDYLKIEWWDDNDFVMDAGTIVYAQPTFRNILYLCTDIGKPEYIFEEEGETRDGYFFPIKQISEKRYRFSFLASEYLLDVMRLIRMADYIVITYHGQEYTPDTFLITPEWEDNGDIASVQAEFDTATVAKKIGASGETYTRLGDFNNDFNNDFSK